jgi:N-acetylmuramoyl-L-alanine amidase
VAVLDYQKNREINLFEVEQVVTSETRTAAAGNNVVYKVQISAGSNKLEAQSYNFKSLPEISREKEGDIYRYFTGNFSSLKEVSELKEKAIAKGYTSAFIVVYEKGERRRL